MRVRGNVLVPDSTILYYGGDFEDPVASLRRLYDTGLFADVRIVEEAGTTVVEVVEKPLLRAVRVEGDARDRVSDEAPRPRPSVPMGELEAREAAFELERFVGPDYEVTPRLVRLSDVQVDLVLVVDERPKTKPTPLSFRGNAALSDDDLSDAVEEARGEEALTKLRERYRRAGYAKARFRPEAAGRVIAIEEGAVHRFGAVIAERNALFSREAMEAFLPRRGERFDGSLLAAASTRIRSAFADRGYPAALVELEEQVRPEIPLVDVIARVKAGPFYRVATITFHGHERHRDRDLRLFLDLTETERYEQDTLERDTSALMLLGNFRAVVPEVDLLSSPGNAIVDYRIEEIPPFEYLGGGGLDGVQGATGNGQFVMRGLSGRGETIRADVDIGNRLQNIATSYHDPTLLGRRMFFDLDFRKADLTYPDETSQNTLDVGLRAYGPHLARWQALLGARYSAFTLGTDLEQEVPFLTPFLGERFRTRRLTAGLVHRSRALELGYEWVSGDVAVHRLRIGSSFRLDVAPRQTLVATARGEALWAYGDTKDEGLPRFERLFLGSENDLRGFPIRGVGPREGTVVVGGDRLVFASLEYRYQLHRRLTVAGFFDLGNVYATDFEGESLPRLRYDAGPELQIVVPYANVPLRIGYGFNLDRLQDEPSGRFFIALALRF